VKENGASSFIPFFIYVLVILLSERGLYAGALVICSWLDLVVMMSCWFQVSYLLGGWFTAFVSVSVWLHVASCMM
jgi:hypothetical protein